MQRSIQWVPMFWSVRRRFYGLALEQQHLHEAQRALREDHVGAREVGPLLGRLLKACGWFGVDRSSPVALKRFQEHVKAEQKAGAVLRLGMFPEGTRSPDGEIQKFHLGPFLVAAELGLPIVPLVINGAYEAHPGGAFTVQPGSIQVRIEPTLVPPTRPRTPREMLAAAMELHRRAENIYRCAKPATAEVPLALQENV